MEPNLLSSLALYSWATDCSPNVIDYRLYSGIKFTLFEKSQRKLMNCRETKRILSQDKIHGNNPVQFLSFVLFL